MRNIFYLIFFSPFFIYSQLENKYIGYLTTTSKDIITYQIDFEIKTDNTISGESTTDIYGINKTKSIITGSYNPKKQLFSFKEIQNTKTKSTSKNDEFCFIECYQLEIKKLAGKEILSGKFIGKYPNGEPCAKGTIYLVSNEVLTNEKINLSSIDSILNAKMEFKTISSKNSITLDWHSKSINFLVWDGSNEDDDIISIYFNDKLIKENLSIKNKKEPIEIPLTKQVQGVLKIKAISTGKEGKNTVNLLFVDETNFYPYVSILEQGESISIEIK